MIDFENSACVNYIRRTGVDLWFSAEGDNYAAYRAQVGEAVKICHTCPLEKQCLKYAISLSPLPSHGVWGGVTVVQLRRLALKAETMCPVCRVKFVRLRPSQITCSSICSRTLTKRNDNYNTSLNRNGLMLRVLYTDRKLFEDIESEYSRDYGGNRATRCCDSNGNCDFPDADWHGTSNGYTNHGCRCPRCRHRHASELRTYRQSKKEEVNADATNSATNSHESESYY